MHEPITQAVSPASLALGFTSELSFPEFGNIAGIAEAHMPTMYGEIEKAGLKPTGPEFYLYAFRDNPTDPDKKETGRLTLTLAIPIDERFQPQAPYAVVDMPEFKFMSLHTESFADWETLRTAVDARGRKRTLIEREVYWNWVGMGAPGNDLELQVGIL